MEPIKDHPGDFRTLNGKFVSVTERVISTGAKFRKHVDAKALGPWSKVSVKTSSASGSGVDSVWVMLISRPLEGGINAPAGIEDMAREDVNRYMP